MNAPAPPNGGRESRQGRGHPWLFVLILSTVGILVIRFMSAGVEGTTVVLTLPITLPATPG